MVTVQTEHLDNHTARLTVDVPAERVEQAVRQSARQIAKKARIPGFRPGKAPFNIIVGMFGYEYVLSQALDKIGNDIYKEALEETELEPYAPGSLEDVEEEGKKLVFVVPKRPEVDLGDYRDIRVEFEVSEVTDKMVEDAMESLREQQAVVEDVERAAKMGDQLVIEHFYVGVLGDDEDADVEDEDDAADADTDEVEAADAEAADAEAAEAEDTDDVEEIEDDAADAAADGDDDDDEDEANEYELFHQHDWTRILRNDDKDLFPGFSAELVDVVAGDELEFYLDLPEDYEDENLAGKQLRIEAHVAKVQSRTEPEWSDELAAKIAEEDEIETILELRIKVREQLAEQAKAQVDREVAEEALEKLVEGATIKYPSELVDDYLDDLIQDLERNMLAPQGLKLDHYLTMTGQTEEEFRAMYRESAENRAKRSLALGEIVNREELVTTDADIQTEIDNMIEGMGGEERAGQFRQYFSSAQSRMNIANQLASDRAIGRLVAIAKGEEPPVGVQRDETEIAESGDESDDAAVADELAVADEPVNDAADALEAEIADGDADTGDTEESE